MEVLKNMKLKTAYGRKRKLGGTKAKKILSGAYGYKRKGLKAKKVKLKRKYGKRIGR